MVFQAGISHERFLTLMDMDKNITVQGKVMRELDFESYTIL